MKKLLFISPNLGSGGGEKSLLTLLTLIDYSEYEVDLLLFNRTGLFLEMLPKQVNVIVPSGEYGVLCSGFKSGMLSWLKRGKLSLMVERMLYAAELRKKLPPLAAGQQAWNHLKKFFPAPEKHYDAAIAYLEGNPLYYCIDCVDADKKILYIHSYYPHLGLDADFDRKYFEQASSVVTVSEVCADAIRETFPGVSSKVKVVYNIVSPRLIRQSVSLGKGFDDGFEGKRLLTVARLCDHKGVDIGLEACSILAEKGFNFRWYVIGRGEQEEMLRRRIAELKLEDRFVLLGEKSNPYEYTGRCDIYVQPSRLEGKSIAIDEAKALALPIVTTAYPTVADQIEDGVTGLVAQIDPASIAASIERLLCSEELCRELSDNLGKVKVGNEEEINNFYSLL